MRTLLLVLGLSTLVLGHQPRQQRGSCNEPNKIIDQLLQYAQQDPEADNSDLGDIEAYFEYRPFISVKVSLSKGRMWGITQQAERSGEAQSQKLEGGQRCSIKTKLQYSRLQVQYGEIKIQSRPNLGIDAHSYEGYLYDVEARLTLEYDEETGEMQLKSYKTEDAQRAQFRLKGAEQHERYYRPVEKIVLREIQKEVQQTMKKQIEDRMEKMSQEYQR